LDRLREVFSDLRFGFYKEEEIDLDCVLEVQW